MTILVVDDDPHTRALHSHFLRKAGYRVLTAASAMEAFDLLQLEQAVPAIQLDLVLMDLRMPEIDGLEACRRVRASAAYRMVPIVFITASDPEESQVAAFDSGAVDYVTKPVFKDKLLERVDALVELNRRLALGTVAPERSEPGGDEVTGLPGRRRLDNEIAGLWAQLSRTGGWISLVVIDVDCRKAFVERRGAAAGDELLRRLAASLRGAAGTRLVVRYAPDQFAVLLAETAPADARKAATGLRTAVRALADEYARDGELPPLVVSLGVASARPAEGGNPEGFTVLADGAVDCAQSAGRNQVAAVELVV